MKRIILLCSVVLAVSTAQATIYTTNWNSGFAGGGIVPDGNFSGWADTRTVSTMPAGILQSVAVNLNLSGGWNGDLYAYLVHSSGFSVLLDRVGPGAYGYGDAGMNVTLADVGTYGTVQGNIGTYGGGFVPTGVWNPDNTSGSLASFLSTAPNGTWSLFIADMSAGGVTTVQNWGLQMDIVAVPEVESWVAAALAGMFGAFWLNRAMWGKNPPKA